MYLCHKSKFHGAFVLNRRVDLHAIDAPDSLVDLCTGDYELDVNAEATHPRPNGMSTLFVYVYEGSGKF